MWLAPSLRRAKIAALIWASIVVSTSSTAMSQACYREYIHGGSLMACATTCQYTNLAFIPCIGACTAPHGEQPYCRLRSTCPCEFGVWCSDAGLDPGAPAVTCVPHQLPSVATGLTPTATGQSMKVRVRPTVHAPTIGRTPSTAATALCSRIRCET